MSWKEWDQQHQRDMDNGVAGARALSALVVVLVILFCLSTVGALIWLMVVMVKAFHWAVLWFLGGGILTVWIGFAVMYIFSSIARLKEPK